MPNKKPWMSYEHQLDKAIKRGLSITDRGKALEYLERIGYYRLSGYWFPFRERSGICCPLEPRRGRKYKKGQTDRLLFDRFKAGARFEDAVQLYIFDKKLRLLTMDALERIEVALRVDIAHTLGRHNSFAYLDSTHFFAGFSIELDKSTGLTKHHQWLSKHAGLINRSNEEFIKHNKEKYGLPLPIWVACEVWDFGSLSTLFGGMREVDQDLISKKYGIGNGRVFASWLRSLNYLRNVCAHHSRLWNRNIIDQPKLPPLEEAPLVASFYDNKHALARPFLLLCIAQHLLGTINPTSSWGFRLRQLLLEEFPNLDHLGLNLVGMGAIEGWHEWSSWHSEKTDGQ